MAHKASALYYHTNSMMLLPLDQSNWLMADFKNWSQQEDEILKQFVKLSKDQNVGAGLFVLKDAESYKKLFSDHSIIEKASKFGVDEVVFYINGFYGENYNSEEMIKNIKGILNINKFYIKEGYANKLFNEHILRKSFKKIEVLKPIKQNNLSELESCIKNNDFIKFEQLASTKYNIQGHVSEGKKIARTMGFPTANLNLEQTINLNYGVYDSKTIVTNIDQEFDSITCYIKNEYGMNVLETYINNLEIKNINGWEIIVTIKKFIRENKKFNNLDEVKEQIKKDIQNCEWKK